MIMIAQDQLQGMTSGRQLDCQLSLSAAEMPMMRIRRQRLFKRRGRRHIDEQVMMSGMRSVDS